MVDENLTAFQRAKQRLKVSHPAEQLLALLDRVEKLERNQMKMLSELALTEDGLPEIGSGIKQPKAKRRGRPKKA